MAFCTTCGANVSGAFCQKCGTPVGAAGAAAAPPPPPPQAAGYQPHAYQPGPPAYGAPPPGMTPMPPARKTSPLIWILVIVFGLIFMGFLGVVGFGFYVAHKVKQAGIDPDLWRSNPSLAVGKILAATNPNVEVVKSDEGAGTVTIRDKTTGKETTMTFDQARNGKFSITADDDKGGKATMQFGGAVSDKNLPSWVPKYPGSEGTSTFSLSGSGSDNAEGGSFAFTTHDAPDKVLSFYKDKAQELGLKVKMNTTTPSGTMFVATDDAEKRSLTTIVGTSDGSTGVSVTYTSK
jgi:hypothetical protein